jgi:hypothetical protein
MHICPLLWLHRLGLCVGYATSAGKVAMESRCKEHAEYTGALLKQLTSSGDTKLMAALLGAVNATTMPCPQRPGTHDLLGPLGPHAYFHGVQGQMPVIRHSSEPPVRVDDVVGGLLEAFWRQVRHTSCDLPR